MNSNLNKKMNKKIILLIICGLVIFALGGILGRFLFGTQKPVTSAQNPITSTPNPKTEMEKRLETLGLNVIKSTTVFGYVQSVSGRTISLLSNKNTMSIDVLGNATIIALSTNGQGFIKKFEEIKTGDYVSINIGITKEDNLEASQVLILPQPKN